MKAIWYTRSGPAAEVLVCGERKMPKPGPGEVLVHLHASSVNPSDVKKRAGAQPAGFENGYVIPHSDGAGIIESVGEGVPDRVGERVWVYQAQYGRNCGTCAEYVAVPSRLAVALPSRVDFRVGACIGIPVMTAHRCVYNAGEPKGKTVLVTGAAGRVGYYAVQWARLGGATVIATAGTDANCQTALDAGADEALNYRDGSLVERIGKIAGPAGVDHVVDVEFGVNADTSAAVLRNCGTVSTYSSSLAPEPVVPFYPMMFKNVTVNMVLVYNMPQAAKNRAIADITRALEHDALQHRIAEVRDMEDAAGAHESIESGRPGGCVIIDTE